MCIGSEAHLLELSANGRQLRGKMSDVVDKEFLGGGNISGKILLETMGLSP